MARQLGLAVYAEGPAPALQGVPADLAARLAPSEQTLKRIDEAVAELLAQAMERSTALLRQRRATLDRCVRALLASETLDEQQLLALVAEPAPPAGAGAVPACVAPLPASAPAEGGARIAAAVQSDEHPCR
jgi:cell division protease FtsH